MCPILHSWKHETSLILHPRPKPTSVSSTLIDSEGWEGCLAHWVSRMLTPVRALQKTSDYTKGSTRVWHQARKHGLLERDCKKQGLLEIQD